MAKTRQEVGKRAIVPAATSVPAGSAGDAALLAKACPDLDDWPLRWQYEEADIAPGRAIVAVFKPFLLDLLHRKVSKTTFNRDRDNLWQAGGAMIQCRHADPDLMRLSIDVLIRDMIEEDGGPLLWPRISESEQKALDATCRKLYRFLNRPAASKSPKCTH